MIELIEFGDKSFTLVFEFVAPYIERLRELIIDLTELAYIEGASTKGVDDRAESDRVQRLELIPSY